MRTKRYDGVYEGSGQPVTVFCDTDQIPDYSTGSRRLIDGLKTLRLADGAKLNYIEVTPRGETRLQVVSTGAIILVAGQIA